MTAFAHYYLFLFRTKFHLLRSAALYYNDSSNNLEKNSCLLFNLPADKPLDDSCKVYSTLRAGNVCTSLHSENGSAATTRQKGMVGNIQSIVGSSAESSSTYIGKLLQPRGLVI